jgi:hypothetical protein
MTALFVSYACDYCDGLVEEPDYDRGWVVWRARGVPAEEYVFRTPEDAARWRNANHLDDFPIVEVRAPIAFRWRTSTGTLKDLVMADALVSIWPDRRFPPGPNRAFIAGAATGA